MSTGKLYARLGQELERWQKDYRAKRQERDTPDVGVDALGGEGAQSYRPAISCSEGSLRDRIDKLMKKAKIHGQRGFSPRGWKAIRAIIKAREDQKKNRLALESQTTKKRGLTKTAALNESSDGVCIVIDEDAQASSGAKSTLRRDCFSEQFREEISRLTEMMAEHHRRAAEREARCAERERMLIQQLAENAALNRMWAEGLAEQYRNQLAQYEQHNRALVAGLIANFTMGGLQRPQPPA